MPKGPKSNRARVTWQGLDTRTVECIVPGMPPDLYSIADLSRLTAVNVRTIRYYIAQGLIAASGESGPGTHYGRGHGDRLRLIRRLQAQPLPLSEIRARLAELTDADVGRLVAE